MHEFILVEKEAYSSDLSIEQLFYIRGKEIEKNFCLQIKDDDIEILLYNENHLLEFNRWGITILQEEKLIEWLNYFEIKYSVCMDNKLVKNLIEILQIAIDSNKIIIHFGI